MAAAPVLVHTAQDSLGHLRAASTCPLHFNQNSTTVHGFHSMFPQNACYADVASLIERTLSKIQRT